jgi:hypothetical protein
MALRRFLVLELHAAQVGRPPDMQERTGIQHDRAPGRGSYAIHRWRSPLLGRPLGGSPILAIGGVQEHIREAVFGQTAVMERVDLGSQIGADVGWRALFGLTVRL